MRFAPAITAIETLATFRGTVRTWTCSGALDPVSTGVRTIHYVLTLIRFWRHSVQARETLCRFTAGGRGICDREEVFSVMAGDRDSKSWKRLLIVDVHSKE